MNTPHDLYAELKADIAAFAEPLFDFSEQCLCDKKSLGGGAYEMHGT
jgi:hypothetical protein